MKAVAEELLMQTTHVPGSITLFLNVPYLFVSYSILPVTLCSLWMILIDILQGILLFTRWPERMRVLEFACACWCTRTESSLFDRLRAEYLIGIRDYGVYSVCQLSHSASFPRQGGPKDGGWWFWGGGGSGAMWKYHLLAMCYVSFCSHCSVKVN